MSNDMGNEEIDTQRAAGIDKKNTSPDEALAELAQNNDNKSMEELLYRYINYVKSRARTFFIIGADSEDLIQEGMIGLYKAIRDYDAQKNTSFKNFAIMCINRQIISAIKTANREKHKPLNNYISISNNYEESGELQLFEIEDTTPNSNPENATILKEIKENLLSKINTTLNDIEISVVKKYLQGKSYHAIASELLLKPKTVDNTLQRIRKKLQKILSDN